MYNLRNVKFEDLKDIIEINEQSIPAVNTVSLIPVSYTHLRAHET